MPLLKIKLISDDKVADMQSAIATYIAGAGAPLATSMRGMAMDMFVDPGDKDRIAVLALAHDGDAIPASKVADLQFVIVEDDKIAAAQSALDAALADVVHHQRTDGDADAFAGDIVVGSAMFASADVGRKITIGTNARTITAFTSSTRVTYSGAAITGTGLTVKLHGAEVLQSMEIAASRDDDGDTRAYISLALEGQLP